MSTSITLTDKQKSLRTSLTPHYQGELRLDSVSRALYATDASIYRIEPLGVALPRTEEDLHLLLEACIAAEISITCRGGGTSLSGQAVGDGLQIDFSKYLNQVIRLERDESRIVVQPGIVLDELNTFLTPYDLAFGPDTASSNRCTIGGMIGNNSCGARSLVYGKTMDHVEALDVLLASGEEIHLSLTNNPSHPLFSSLLNIVGENKSEILARFPKIPRRVSGYNLDTFIGEGPFNMSSIIVGSEGTLAILKRAYLKLVPRPKIRALLVAEFSDLFAALEASESLKASFPSAIEIIDKMILQLASQSLEYKRYLGFLKTEAEAVLFAEYSADSEEEVGASLVKGEDILKKSKAYGSIQRMLKSQDQQKIWKVRKAGLPLLLGIPGPRKPIAFVEDTAVPPEKLTAYIRCFDQIVGKHGTIASYYAHAGSGCLHIRPLLNLKEDKDVQTMHMMAQEISQLVLEFGGALSGEHGDGLARSEFQEKMFGHEIYQAFRNVKKLFDPNNILNPGKIVDAQQMVENLRYGARYKTFSWPTTLQFKKEGGLAPAIELCNGAGVCRKKLEGTMCPSYRVTAEEQHSTRGRANALREVLSGTLPFSALQSRQLFEVMELCIACKGCKAECPSNVDMAKIKSEFLHHYYRKNRRPIRSHLFAALPKILTQIPAPLLNFGSSPILRRLNHAFLGIHKKRALPKISSYPWNPSASHIQKSSNKKILFYPDTFTKYFEPHLAALTVDLLEKVGFQVLFPPKKLCCGRTYLTEGKLEKFKKLVKQNLNALAPFIQEGIPIVGLEPSCLLTFKDEYLDMSDDPLADKLARQTFLIENLLGFQKENLFQAKIKDSILYHLHCHQKALLGPSETQRFFTAIGVQAKLVDSGCCGLAGPFGFEKEHYDLSLAMGERALLPAARQHEGTVVATGFSCRKQIFDATGKKALHPIELLNAI